MTKTNLDQIGTEAARLLLSGESTKNLAQPLIEQRSV